MRGAASARDKRRLYYVLVHQFTRDSDYGRCTSINYCYYRAAVRPAGVIVCVLMSMASERLWEENPYLYNECTISWTRISLLTLFIFLVKHKSSYLR